MVIGKDLILIGVLILTLIIGSMIGYRLGKEKDAVIGDLIFNMNDPSKEMMEIHIKCFPSTLTTGDMVKLNLVINK